jgi:hypothetical protein
MLNGLAIVKVCYNDNTKRDTIKSVKAARFTSKDGKTTEIMGNIVSWSKGQIIGMLTDPSDKTRVFTATIENDICTLNQEVVVYPENEPKYIRTERSTSERDDLDEVPVYVAHC